MSQIQARPSYHRRAVPSQYDAGWVGAEFAAVQRAIPTNAIRTARTDDAPSATDHTVCYDATTAPITVTLPNPAQVAGLELRLKKVDASAHVVTLAGTVDGVAGRTLATQYKALILQSDGASWFLLGSV